MSTLIINEDDPYAVGRSETLPLAIDFSDWLAAGETISSAAVQVFRLSTGADVPTAHVLAPSINGAVVTQVTVMLPLIEGEFYHLRITPTVSATKIPTCVLVLEVKL